MSQVKSEAFTDLVIIPVNKNRSKYVDFTIICKNQATGKKVKYGVEKAVISSASTFFNDMFEACSGRGKDEKEELEMMEMDSEAIFKFLKAISSVADSQVWSVDQSSDVIDLCVKYGADFALNQSLFKFWRSFVEVALDTGPITSKYDATRYGKATIIKFISLWLRVVNEGWFRSAEMIQIYFWGIEKLWPSWCRRCNTSSDKATILDFIDYESGKYFTGDDICIATIFIDNLRKGMTKKDLGGLLERLKKEKLERQEKE